MNELEIRKDIIHQSEMDCLESQGLKVMARWMSPPHGRNAISP